MNEQVAIDIEDDPVFIKVLGQFDGFYKKVEERIAEEEKKMAACKRKDELEMRLTDEQKLYRSLEARLAALTLRGAALARSGGGGAGPAAAAAAAAAGGAAPAEPTLAPSDQLRLNTARQMYLIAKELTGVRWDFTAPPDLAKGFVKNASRRVLEPFELSAGPGRERRAELADRLWARITP